MKKLPMPKAVHQGPAKPPLKVRHIKPGGRSSFPAAASAFGPTDASAQPAFPQGPDVGAAMGDAGA